MQQPKSFYVKILQFFICNSQSRAATEHLIPPNPEAADNSYLSNKYIFAVTNGLSLTAEEAINQNCREKYKVRAWAPPRKSRTYPTIDLSA